MDKQNGAHLYNGISLSHTKEWHRFHQHGAPWEHHANWMPLLSHFSHVRLCATPSLGFSRQEHWSGLPFPSPMHKSEKWKWSRSVRSDSSRPRGLQPTRLLCPWDFPGKSTGVGCHCLLRLTEWHTYKRPHAIRFHLYERSKTGKSIETESRFMVARAWGVTADGDKFSLWDDKMLLKLTVVMAAQLCEYTTNQQLYTCNRWIV